MADITIALDAMGGDHGCSVVVPAALKVCQDSQNVHMILVGDEKQIAQTLRQNHALDNPKISIHHASEVVAMNEPPGQALRFKKNSSMRVAINLVKEGVAQACVSAGNTGALMATAKFVLKTLPGIDRPAISALWPTMKPNAHVRVLDLGANVDSSPEQLFEFAVMGSVLASAVSNITNPKVGLLNIGSEEIKGNEQVKITAKLLENNPAINYIGFVEGDGVYKGIADVVVCDGFVGNIALKTSEGVAKLVRQYIKTEFEQNWLSRLAGLAVMPILRRLGKRLNPGRYNGASLLGLRGTVIKSHGGADIFAFANAITEALAEVQNDVPARISSEVEQILQQRQQT